MDNNEEYEDRGDLLDDSEDEILDENEDDSEDEILDENEDDSEEDLEDDSEDEILDENEDDFEEDLEDDSEEDFSKSSKTIPKYRLDEVIAQREAEKERSKWLESQLEKLISQQLQKEEEPVVQFDFAEAEQKYVDLIIEGETSEAAKLRNKIDSERKKEYMSVIEQIKKDNESSITDATNKSTETLKFNNLVESYESKYSFLNADSKEYNEEAVDTVNTLMSGYKASGMSNSEALTKAVKKVVPFYKSDNQSVGLGRTKAARKKSISASRSQPPKTRSSNTSNVDTSSLDVSKLSERDFDKLTDREKRALRGD